MDWTAAIEKNREALKRILATLVAMAGLAGGAAFTSPLWGGRREALGGGTLPRHLHRAVLRLLRPAEAATRRLVIVAARGIVVMPPPPRSAWSPSPASQGRIRSGQSGTTWILPRSRGRGTTEGGGGGIAKPYSARRLTLPLFDRLPRWGSRPRRPVATSVPRISVPGYSTPAAITPPRLPSPGDPVDAVRLGRRLAALASALDDLPRQAKRFARWRATRDAIRAQTRNHDAAAQPDASRLPYRPRRLWPLRPGHPPGWRRKPDHEVHDILKDLHGLAFWALERRDTS